MSAPRIVHARNPRRTRTKIPAKLATKAPAKLADMIVRPKRKAAPPPEDASVPHVRGDAAKALWRELVRRTEEASGKKR